MKYIGFILGSIFGVITAATQYNPTVYNYIYTISIYTVVLGIAWYLLYRNKLRRR